MIRDVGMPLTVDDFSEDFANHPIVSSLDFYSGYNQLLLAPQCRDQTVFLTALGLIRQTRLPQGWINSVAIFERIINKVLFRHIPHHARSFFDDVGIRGPLFRYNDEFFSPGIRRFVWEHSLIVREVLKDIWMSGLTVDGRNLCLEISQVAIVGMVCNEKGRRPEWRKVQKVLDWPALQSVTGVCTFLSFCT
jgi:hypothetical protein